MKNKNVFLIVILTVILIVCIAIIVGIAINGNDFWKSGFSAFLASHTGNSSEEIDNKEDEEVVIEDEPNEIEEVEETPTIEENTTVSGDLSSIISQETTTPSESNSSSTLTSESSSKKTYLGNYEVKGKISIPKTGIEYQILNEVTTDSLNQSVAILSIVANSSLDNAVTELNVKGTNTLILGHNYKNGTFFSDNYKLSEGDKIYITDNSGNKVTYTIYDTFYTDANDVSFMEDEVSLDSTEISLETCNDDTTQRLVIRARAN